MNDATKEPGEVTLQIPAQPPTGHQFQISNDDYAIVFSTPVNRFQRFLQLLVGIQWRQRI